MSGGTGTVYRTAWLRPELSEKEPSSGAGPANHSQGRAVLVMAGQAAAPRISWVVQSVMVVAALPTATPCARFE